MWKSNHQISSKLLAVFLWDLSLTQQTEIKYFILHKRWQIQYFSLSLSFLSQTVSKQALVGYTLLMKINKMYDILKFQHFDMDGELFMKFTFWLCTWYLCTLHFHFFIICFFVDFHFFQWKLYSWIFYLILLYSPLSLFRQMTFIFLMKSTILSISPDICIISTFTF